MIKQILISTIALLLLFGGSAKAQGYEGKWWTSVANNNDYPHHQNMYVIVKKGGSYVGAGTIYVVVDGVLRGQSSAPETLGTGAQSMTYFLIDAKVIAAEDMEAKNVRIIYSDGTDFYEAREHSFNDFSISPALHPDLQSNLVIINLDDIVIQDFSITFRITEVMWATLMLPFDCNIPTQTDAPEPKSAEIMALKSSSSHGGEGYEGKKIYLTLKKQQGDQFIANTPYILYGTPGTYTVTGTITGATPITVTEGYLTGNNAPVELKVHDHAMQNHSGAVGYYNVPNTGIILPAYRAFMTDTNADHALKNPVEGIGSSNPNQAPGILFMIEDDDPTFINKINSENAAIPMFDLSGRPVNVPVKGNVYIKNGKKILK